MVFRLFAITQAADDPATRYRLGQYVSLLGDHGVRVTARPWPREEDARERILAEVKDHDGVVVFRRLLALRHVKRLRESARYLAFDFDDAVTRRDSSLGLPWPLLEKVFQFRRLVQCADAISAGNEHLAEQARRAGARGNLRVVPTTIDLSRYPGRDIGGATDAPVLGWIGQPTTAYYVDQLMPALLKLTKRYSDLSIRCVGGRPRWSTRAGIDFKKWSGAEEVNDLMAFTVGLAPLVDDAWTRGKCGLRLLQYLAAGVPAVAAPVGVQGAIVARGAALGATTHAEWVEQVGALLEDSTLRTKLTRLGRQLVEDEFVPTKWIDVVMDLWCGTGVKRQLRPTG